MTGNKIKILFVCHGNICRSPMAEFIFKDLARKRGIDGFFTVSSAATSSEEIYNGVGNPIYPPAREQLLKHGIASDGKRAVQIKKSDYEKYDYIIGMDDRNIQNMLRVFGGDKDKKIYKLLEFAGESRSVADPWYSDNFDVAYSDILHGCEALINELAENVEM